jgi:hypothetical protein
MMMTPTPLAAITPPKTAMETFWRLAAPGPLAKTKSGRPVKKAMEVMITARKR